MTNESTASSEPPTGDTGSDTGITLTKERHETHLLRFVDGVILILVISPFQIVFWRGFWQLTDVFLFPSDEVASAFASFAVGHTAHFLSVLSCHRLQKYSDGMSFRAYVATSRIFAVFVGAYAIWEWRGTWQLMDAFLSCTWDEYSISAAVSYVILVSLRLVNTTLSTPFGIEIDRRWTFYSGVDVSFFKRKWDGHLDWVSIGDRFLAVFLISQPSIVFWRGIWGLQDELFGEDLKQSALISTFLGLALTIFCFSIHKPIRLWTKSLSGVKRLLVEDTYLTICGIGCITLWRGYWAFCDAYIFPDYTTKSNAITAVVGLLVTIILSSSSSISNRGLFRDGEMEGGFDLQIEFLAPYISKIQSLLFERRPEAGVEDPEAHRLQTPNSSRERTVIVDCSRKDTNDVVPYKE